MSTGGSHFQLIVISRPCRFLFPVHVESLESERAQEQKGGRLTTSTTGTALGVLDARRYTSQRCVTALEQYPEAPDVSSSCMHKANSHMASPACFLFLYRGDSVCQPQLRDRQPPTEAHQRRPPTAAKGNCLGLHTDTASWVHKELDEKWPNASLFPSKAKAPHESKGLGEKRKKKS